MVILVIHITFCDNDKNKDMINNYSKIANQLEDEIFSWTDEFKDEDFIFGGNFMRFRFKTDDNLVYKIFCSITETIIINFISTFENIYCPQFKLQKCFYEVEIC